MKLFSSPKRRKRQGPTSAASPAAATHSSSATHTDKVGSSLEVGAEHTAEGSWRALGLSKWLARSCVAMGMRSPTPVQRACIGAVIAGRDVIASAPTGSGKTAAFALPILQTLSEDPFGIYAVVLTPARELAIQIAEQFEALGAAMNLRHAVVIGGVDLVEQALELQRMPHVVVATPGRLRDHLTRSSLPPDLSRAPVLVLDEADRLLGSAAFERDLAKVLSAMSSRRSTLLLSATMTAQLQTVRTLALHEPLLYSENGIDIEQGATDCSNRDQKQQQQQQQQHHTTVSTLSQYYVFMPAQVKPCYLTYVMEEHGPAADESNEDEHDSTSARPRTSCIIFAATCRGCQTIAEMLGQLGMQCASLHSALSQDRRLASLGKFRAGVVNILVCTDVASRGLDIPAVELVVNYDVPRRSDDYIHRVGRTARAGRGGRAISLVTQYDVELVHTIETAIGKQLEQLPSDENDVLRRLNRATDALRTAKLELERQGFDELLEQRDKRRREQRARTRARKADEQKSQMSAPDEQARGRVKPKHRKKRKH